MKELHVPIHRDELVAARLHPDYLAVFDALPRLYDGDQEVVIVWSQLAMVWALSHPGRDTRWCFWMMMHHAILPTWSLAGADLTRADLTDAHLPGADLTRANLMDADLTRADLTGAYYPRGDVPAGWTRNSNGYLARA